MQPRIDNTLILHYKLLLDSERILEDLLYKDWAISKYISGQETLAAEEEELLFTVAATITRIFLDPWWLKFINDNLPDPITNPQDDMKSAIPIIKSFKNLSQKVSFYTEKKGSKDRLKSSFVLFQSFSVFIQDFKKIIPEDVILEHPESLAPLEFKICLKVRFHGEFETKRMAEILSAISDLNRAAGGSGLKVETGTTYAETALGVP